MREKSFQTMVRKELQRARNKFTPMSSLHEGYAVIQEEVDELWNEVKGQQRDDALIEELIQIAAMCQRMTEDVIWEFEN